MAKATAAAGAEGRDGAFHKMACQSEFKIIIVHNAAWRVLN